MTMLELVTQYAFNMTFIGMAAGTVYFVLERNNMTPRLSPVASLAAMVTVIAAINYYNMGDLVESAVAGTEAFAFPTEYRYTDWILTTPLLLAIITLLTGQKPVALLLTKLMVADVAMILLGYFGEVTINQAGASLAGWSLFLASMVPFAYILVVLFGEIGEAANQIPASARGAFDLLRYFIAVGWMIYPLGFLISLLGIGGDFLLLRELAYSVADLVNKVGFGLVAIHVAKTLSLHEAGLTSEAAE